MGLTARDWFNRVRNSVVTLAEAERDAEEAEAATYPKGQQYGSVSHGGSGDGSGAMIRYAMATTELDAKRAECEAMLERATDVLYGRSGRGGLAKRKGTATADCICGYYLLGMSWREVADEMVQPDSEDGRHWCMMRAHRAFDYMDRAGMDWLIDS